ncbi:hypothetical protein [Devosia sp. CAU 1758]
MVGALARKIPYLLLRDGRYFARRTVPKELQSYIGLREPLGPDRKIALEKLHPALVKINARLDHARRALAAQQGADAAQAAARAAPMTPAELARTHYNDQLALDEALRDSGPSWASVGIDDAYVADLRAASSGSLQDDQFETLLGSFLKRYALRGISTPRAAHRNGVRLPAQSRKRSCRFSLECMNATMACRPMKSSILLIWSR